MPPRPGMVRRSFSTASAAVLGSAGVVAGEHQHVLLARAAQAHLRARRAGFQRGADVGLDALLARALAARHPADGQRGLARFGIAAAATVAPPSRRRWWCTRSSHAPLRPRAGARPRPRAVCSQRGAGRQLQVHLGLRVVVRRDEARGQQRDERERTHKERNGGGKVIQRCWMHHGPSAGRCPSSAGRRGCRRWA